MSTAALAVGGREIPADAADLQPYLRQARARSERPRCLCTTDGVEMYIARVGTHLIVKRMPNSGSTHAPVCEHYAPPPELSGLGAVQGSAIEEGEDETRLKLAFALSKSAGKAPDQGEGSESDSVATDGTKLTMRALLHYLWEEAGFHRWSPAMAGKRNPYVLRKYLSAAAADKTTKKTALSESLWIPEPHNDKNATQIAGRRLKAMLAGAGPIKGKSGQRLMLALGEVERIAAGRLGHQLVLTETPDCQFLLPDDLHKKMSKRFATELALWAGDDDVRLIVFGTFAVTASGVPTFQELTLMVTTSNWIPFESAYDKLLVETVTAAHRPFVKGLRYNLATTVPIAAMVLPDTGEQSTALYLADPADEDTTRQQRDELLDASELASWVWNTGDDMPALPTRIRTTHKAAS